MNQFVIIETESGFQIVALPDGKTADEVAKEHGGILVDEGPYPTFEAAEEILATMPNPYEADRT